MDGALDQGVLPNSQQPTQSWLHPLPCFYRSKKKHVQEPEVPGKNEFRNFAEQTTDKGERQKPWVGLWFPPLLAVTGFSRAKVTALKDNCGEGEAKEPISRCFGNRFLQFCFWEAGSVVSIEGGFPPGCASDSVQVFLLVELNLVLREVNHTYQTWQLASPGEPPWEESTHLTARCEMYSTCN